MVSLSIARLLLGKQVCRAFHLRNTFFTGTTPDCVRLRVWGCWSTERWGDRQVSGFSGLVLQSQTLEDQGNAKCQATLKTNSRESQKSTYCGLVLSHPLLLVLMTWAFLQQLPPGSCWSRCCTGWMGLWWEHPFVLMQAWYKCCAAAHAVCWGLLLCVVLAGLERAWSTKWQSFFACLKMGSTRRMSFQDGWLILACMFQIKRRGRGDMM